MYVCVCMSSESVRALPINGWMDGWMGCKHVTDGARGGRVTATCPDRFMLWPQVLQWEWGFVECRVLDLRAFNQGVSADELQRQDASLLDDKPSNREQWQRHTRLARAHRRRSVTVHTLRICVRIHACRHILTWISMLYLHTHRDIGPTYRHRRTRVARSSRPRSTPCVLLLT